MEWKWVKVKVNKKQIIEDNACDKISYLRIT